MAFIGNTPTTQAFTPAIDYFSGNGSTTAFTLSRPVASVAQVQVTIDNVAQNPSSAFTVSANTITFTSAPLSGTNNIYVYYTSPITQVIAPGQGTVNTTALGNITNIASGNSSLTLQTGPSNTTAVTVDTSQNTTFAGNTTISKAQAISFLTNTTGTNSVYSQYTNTSGSAYVGLNNSSGGDFGNAAYALQVFHAGSYPIVFSTANTERMRLNTSGTVILQGGSTSATGVGIAFPATQSASSDANTLDDYEEGTYTPVFSASGLTYTQGTTLAKYVKVGRLVTFTASVQWSGKSGGTGDLKISIPFVASSDSGAWQGLFVFGYSSGINVVIKTGYCDPGATQFNPVRADSSTSIIQAGDMAAGGHIIFGGTYQT